MSADLACPTSWPDASPPPGRRRSSALPDAPSLPSIVRACGRAEEIRLTVEPEDSSLNRGSIQLQHFGQEAGELVAIPGNVASPEFGGQRD